MNQKIVIELLPNGQIQVSGPIENKIFCYGLLEAAKDAIREHVAQKMIQVPQLSIVPNHGKN